LTSERKIFLDWLRVAAFFILILFHIGMLYVPWNYNIKSERIFPDLEYVMLAISPWRLVLLFFISGVASHYLVAKLGPGRFSLDRIRRLFVVLLLGMYVINPAQVYVEFLDEDLIDGGYLDFWINAYLPGDPFPNRNLPTWDHLWFLLYLLLYSLGFALIAKVSRLRGDNAVPLVLLMVVPGLWLCLTNALIQEFSPVTQALFNDWANHLRWIGIFAAGVVCAGNRQLWAALGTLKRRLLAVSIVGLLLQTIYGMLARANAIDPAWYGTLHGVVEGFYGWTVVLTLLAYASEYLNRRTKALTYLTDAVLPVYVVHQPIMLVTAYLLFPLTLPVFPEVMLLVLATTIGSLAFYEGFVRRWTLSRFLFGLKAKPVPAPP
jgi:surface polysaccharide O-acyltransferase-like enzyme